MKKIISTGILRTSLFLVLLVCLTNISKAQLLALYSLRSGGSNPTIGLPFPGTVASCVNAGAMVVGSTLDNSGDSRGFRFEYNGSDDFWPSVPTDGCHIQFPFSPKPGTDFNISSISFRDTIPENPPVNLMVLVTYQVDGAGPWKYLAGPVNLTSTVFTDHNLPTNETFYNGHTYIIRFYVYGNGGSVDDGVRKKINALKFNGTCSSTPAQAVTVNTLTATATGKYTGDVTGSYTYSGTQYYLVKQSGFIWSTSSATIATLDTSATTKTTNGSAGTINSTLTGLSAGTTYYVKAYIVTQFGIQYGSTLSFKTSDATAPTVTTNAITNVLSNKATGGGAIPDSGGLPITAKGLVWNLTGSPTLSSNTGKIVLAGGNSPFNFTDLMKGLNPSTNYCYRAFATNSLGTTYGNDVCFTTAAPAPVLIAIPGTIDFGENFFGSSSLTVSYNLTGTTLSPASGNILISIPSTSGFLISLSSTSGFGTSLSLPYTGGKIPKTPIFVKFPTTSYGTFNGIITHSGGGVQAADADIVNLKGTIVASPEDITNKGNDFWTGFGFEEAMAGSDTDPTTRLDMSIYIAAGSQPASGFVEIPGLGFKVPFSVGAFSTTEVKGFPILTGQAEPDCRLYKTGVFNKAIHIYTTNGSPISVWEHSYVGIGKNSAAAMMLFPTNTWNSSYSVQAYGGATNNKLPGSYFFVIASEDNTEIRFRPSVNVLDPSAVFQEVGAPVLYPASTSTDETTWPKIILNKGQVFNAMGAYDASGNGLDLSGSIVKTTSCDKKIAVFGGNGRVLVNTTVRTFTSGSDHLMQQMFPKVAWGTKYLTAPTKTMEYNLFRIYVDDLTTKVTVNGAPVAGGLRTPGNYYVLETNKPSLIESDKPISVTQFIIAGSNPNPMVSYGNGGSGDPEMIILSPILQAINNAVVYSAPIKDGKIGCSFINVIIKKEGVASFKLDPATNVTQMVDTGRSSYSTTNVYGAAATLIPKDNAFIIFPGDPNYRYARFRVATGSTHVLTSDVPFNAIAYGLADGESYGYNAGTAIKNLSSYKISVNPKGTDSSSTIVRTCKNIPITLKIAFPYNPSLVNKIVWEPNDGRITPNAPKDGAISGGKAVYDGTIDIDGRTFYIYTSPVQYTFSENALYRFKATAFGTFASDCPGQDIQTILVNVGQDNLNLHADPKCNDPKVLFTADTIPMVGTNILSWKWEFGDNTTSTTNPLSPQLHDYGTTAVTAYRVKLTTLNTVGCYSSDSVDIDFGGGLKADFTITKTSLCSGDNTTFADASFGSGTSGTPDNWKWSFGDGKTFDGQTPPAQTYATPGIKNVSLTVSTPNGCVNKKDSTITVEATPVPKFSATTACKGSATTFTDESTIAIGAVETRVFDFGDGTPAVTTTNATVTHSYAAPGDYTASLTVKSLGGCTSTTPFTKTVTVVPLPRDSFAMSVNCTTKEVIFTDKSVTNGGTITKYNWTVDGIPVTKSATFPQTFNDALKHYVTLSVETSNGCSNTTPYKDSFTISASPVADFEVPTKVCLPNDAATFTNKTTISDGTDAQISYTWEFGDNSTQNQAAPAPMTISHPYATAQTYNVKLTAKSGAGCTNSVTKPLTNVYAQPKASFTTPAPAEACLNAKAALSGTGTSGAEWYWNFGTGFGAVSKKDTVGVWNISGDTAVKHYYVTTQGCISDTISKTIKVNPLPKDSFAMVVDCTKKEVIFTDKSTANAGTITKYNWTIDGVPVTPSPGATFPRTFNDAVKHYVTLSIETSKGCSNPVAYKDSFTISASPVADFDVPAKVCLPNDAAIFTNKTAISDGTENQISYTWDFGDNSTQNQAAPAPATISHTYATAQTYNVKLTATSNNGCTNSITKPITSIFAQPKATFNAAAEACLN
ncbi:MAG: PKD domain-containing protein, partial [Bacteroidota bacterium]